MSTIFIYINKFCSFYVLELFQPKLGLND